MNRDGPAYRYYAALEGSYLGDLSFQVTNWPAFRASKLSLTASMRVRSMSLMPGQLKMATTLSCDKLASEGLALHTTYVSKWRTRVAGSRETIAVEPDGRSLRMTGTQAMWPTLSRDEPYEAVGEIDASATRARYEIPWLGITMVQRTEIVPGGLRLTQETPWSRAEVVLLRR